MSADVKARTIFNIVKVEMQYINVQGLISSESSDEPIQIRRRPDVIYTSPMATPVATTPTGAQLALAFEGKLERKRVAILYRLGVLAVACVMVVLPLIYVATVVAVATGVWWHATHDAWWMASVGQVPRLMIFVAIVYAIPIIAGVLIVLFMLAPLWPRRHAQRKYYWVDRREQPLLYAYIDRLCDTMRAPRPARINLVADANAWVHIDNGWVGIIRRRLVLTIGLPLVAALPLREFTGVVAHEMGHFAQGGSMRLSAVVHRINGWLARLAWDESPVDRMIDEWNNGDTHWTMLLIGVLAKLGVALARLLFKALAIAGHAVTRSLSRQAEFDADHQAARVVGSDATAAALADLLYINAGHTAAMVSAQKGWDKRRLPDDLVQLADYCRRALPADVKSSIEASVLSHESRWFDSHPPLFKRIAALKKARLKGVLKLDAPATCLFKDFDELSKYVTIDAYQSILGPKLQPEHLVEVDMPVSPAASTAHRPRPRGNSPSGPARTASR
ncbi:MAG: heat shock protein HtpX [Phycisphaerales bacterium]|nr:heat shock protein HtpX [Phycisphaerales bacterium]